MRQRGERVADRGCELETVAGARRADDDAPVAFEHELLVRRIRVEARLCGQKVAGADVPRPRPLARPGSDARVRDALRVQVGDLARVVQTRLQPATGRREGVGRLADPV